MSDVVDVQIRLQAACFVLQRALLAAQRVGNPDLLARIETLQAQANALLNDTMGCLNASGQRADG